MTLRISARARLRWGALGMSAFALTACAAPAEEGDAVTADATSSSSVTPSASNAPAGPSAVATVEAPNTEPSTPTTAPSTPASLPVAPTSSAATPLPTSTPLPPRPVPTPDIAPTSESTAGAPSAVVTSEQPAAGGQGGNAGAAPQPTTGGSGTAGGGGTANGGTSGSAPTTPVDTSTPRTIWLAGDSTMANGNTPCPTGWGKHFQDLFIDSASVVNNAVGGRSVRTWMYQVQTEMGSDGECLLTAGADGEPALQDRWQSMLDQMAEGDALLIQFGINDGSPTCDRHVGLDAFKESYGVLAEAAKERGTQPVFLTPVSSIGCSGNTAIGTRGSYVDVTFEAGEDFDVPVLDLHQRSVDLYAERGFCPVPGGDVSASTTGDVGEFFCDDHTHFSEVGAPQIAELVAAGLRDLGLPIAEYLK